MTQIIYPKNTPECIYKLISYFEALSDNKNTPISSFYDNGIIFKDPIHEIESIVLLEEYFQKLNRNLKSGGFTFKNIEVTDHKCYLEWDMEVELYRPNKRVFSSGISVLTFTNKVVHHRDYFDAGELFYEHVPILGSMIRFIKRKIAK